MVHKSSTILRQQNRVNFLSRQHAITRQVSESSQNPTSNLCPCPHNLLLPLNHHPHALSWPLCFLKRSFMQGHPPKHDRSGHSSNLHLLLFHLQNFINRALHLSSSFSPEVWSELAWTTLQPKAFLKQAFLIYLTFREQVKLVSHFAQSTTGRIKNSSNHKLSLIHCSGHNAVEWAWKAKRRRQNFHQKVNHKKLSDLYSSVFLAKGTWISTGRISIRKWTMKSYLTSIALYSWQKGLEFLQAEFPSGSEPWKAIWPL